MIMFIVAIGSFFIRVRGHLLIVIFLLLNSIAHAQAKTPEELCIERNAASCEINGLKFIVTEEECPRGAKVLRTHGHERCDQLSVQKSAVEKKPGTVEKSKESAVEAASSPVPVQQDSSPAIWENPYFILALIGLLQGMISRANVATFIIVGVVMPVIATWAMMSGVKFPNGMTAALAITGVGFAGFFLVSIAGWIAGLGLHRGVLKLLYR